MLAELLFQLFEFAVRTAVLLGLLWVMIKLQRFNRKYEYRFLKLLGAAALASGLDMVPYAGHFLAVPVLWVGVKKVTHADYVETLLTIAVSYALVFGGNRFLLGPLMGNLRMRVENGSALEFIHRLRPVKKAEPATATVTNPPVLQTNLPGSAVPPDSETASATNPPSATADQAASGAAANVAVPPPAKPSANLVRYISVKGVTRNGPNSAATIQSGTKTYTVFLEEAALMQTPSGPVSVRFAGLGTNSVTLEINGEPVKYQIR